MPADIFMHNYRRLDYGGTAVGLGLMLATKRMAKALRDAGEDPYTLDAAAVVAVFIEAHPAEPLANIWAHVERINLANFIANYVYQLTTDCVVAGRWTQGGWQTLGHTTDVEEVNPNTGVLMRWQPLLPALDLPPGTPVSIARIGGVARYCL